MLPLIDSTQSPVLRGVLNGLVFIASLFLLERSADIFVESTEVVAGRLGVPSILVGLLTAGAEWEELAVVVASLIQRHPALALSNIYGSSIANILGSFSIGLLFNPKKLEGSELKSAKIYTGLLLALTLFITFIGSGVGPVWNLIAPGSDDNQGTSRWVIGSILIATFVFYVAGVAYGIYKGVVIPPEGSDSDSDSTSDSSDEDDSSLEGYTEPGRAEFSREAFEGAAAVQRDSASERTPLVNGRSSQRPAAIDGMTRSEAQMRARQRSKLIKNIGLLLLSTVMLSLAGYLLSSTTSSLAEVFHLTQSSLGLTLLSIATTLPEKLVAFKSGRKSQTGVLVANTVGSNVFLGSLVLGVVWLAQGRVVLNDDDDSLRSASAFFTARKQFLAPDVDDLGKSGALDAFMVLGSAIVITAIVWVNAFKRWIGIIMLMAYVAYIVSVFVRGGSTGM